MSVTELIGLIGVVTGLIAVIGTVVSLLREKPKLKIEVLKHT